MRSLSLPRRELTRHSGELLLDQQKFQESVERFDKSLELDKNRLVPVCTAHQS